MSLNQHFFYNITRKVIVSFSDIFNDIDIARYDQDGNITKFITVPLKVSPKTKQWYWTELRDNQDRRDSIFPMIAVDLTNMEYASDRQVNRNMKIEANNNGSSIDRFYNPIPYDFTFNVQIASQYITDITQITEQILPYFAPEGYIRITVPELNISGLSPEDEAGSDILELRVTCDSSDSDMQTDLEEAGYRIILWTLQFKVQGYLFTPLMESGSIHKIITSYYLSDEAWSKRLDDTGNMFYETGNASLNGVVFTTGLPFEDQPVDDSYRRMAKYEHYPRWCNALLYTDPPLESITSYPATFEIKSSIPLREIWYTVTEVDNEYVVDGNSDFIIYDGKFVILSSDNTIKPTFKYVEPITLGVSGTSIRYIVEYAGIDFNGSLTKDVFYSDLGSNFVPIII